MGGRTDAQKVSREEYVELNRKWSALRESYTDEYHRRLEAEARLAAVEDALRDLLDYIGVDPEDSAEKLESFDAPSVVVIALRLLAAVDTGQGTTGVE